MLPFSGASAVDCVFSNPIVAQGQDPSVVFHDGFFYLVQSTAGQLTVAKSATLTGLGQAAAVPVFVPPMGQLYSYDMWAPELVILEGQWYIYVAATSAAGANATHRMYVLQADTADPQGSWTMRGKVYDASSDKWAIDGTVFNYNGQLYMVWSGWPGDQGDFPQNLYIAPMSDPLTISGERHLLSEPDQPWERSVAAINEGPEAFIHNGTLSIVYSADASWTPAYKLGMITLVGDNPLDTASWQKTGPVFSGYNNASGVVYGVGHNSMPVTSPDGSESWLVFHVKTVAKDGWNDRAIFAQKFTWNDDGTPSFGIPIPAATAQALPAGDSCGLVVEGAQVVTGDTAAQFPGGVFDLSDAFVDTGKAWVNTMASFSVTAWVRLDRTGTPAAILSQDGGINSNFALEYTGGTLAFTAFDAFGKNAVSATGTLGLEADRWYHVAGVRDARSGELRLYVDGQLEGSASADQNWDSRGSTIIGGARQGTKRVNLFSGSIRGIAIYNGALSAEEVGTLSLSQP